MTGQHSSNVKEHFEEIYEKTKRSVTLFLISRCKSFDDVNDVLQEVYMEYFRILQKKGIAYVRDEEPFLISLCKKETFIILFILGQNSEPDIDRYIG